MTFDELMNYLLDEDRIQNEEKEQQAVELILETLNVGARVLNNIPKERIAGMMSLVQSATFQAAMSNGELMAAAMTQHESFSDVIVYMFQATAGILTMEEIR